MVQSTLRILRVFHWNVVVVIGCEQECSVLSFLLDRLLPSCQDVGDKDTPALCRLLIASVAACNHSPDAQTVLTVEIKSALQRAMALPESAEKHSRVQAIAGIIGTVIEACPVSGQIQNQVFAFFPRLMEFVMTDKLNSWMYSNVVTYLICIYYRIINRCIQNPVCVLCSYSYCCT